MTTSCLHPHAWYSDKGIRFIAGDPAVRIDRPRKQVYTEKGEVVDYDRLILATGSKPFIPPIAGADLKGVIKFPRYLRHQHHAGLLQDQEKCRGNRWWTVGT